MSLAQDITRAKGGDWSGNQGLIPGPGHSAKDRSMSVRDNDAGDDVILHSFANDEWKPYKDALRAEGLLPEQGKARAPSKSAGAAYVYRDADGGQVFRVVRKAGKRFIAEHPDGRDGWQAGMAAAKPIPYRLPQLIAADREAAVFICEGEKDADALAALGCITTTNPFGAGKWLQGFAHYVEGRNVFVLADNDKAGRDHADDVARKVSAAARTVAIIDLPGLPDKGDVSDWIAAGGTLPDLYRLAGNATPWRERQPGNDNDAPRQFDDGTASLLGKSSTTRNDAPQPLPLEWFADMEPQLSGLWLIKKLIPAHGLALIFGHPGSGKSFVALDFAFHVALGCHLIGATRNAGTSRKTTLPTPCSVLRATSKGTAIADRLYSAAAWTQRSRSLAT